MADVVDTIVIRNTPRAYYARFTNVSDGTGESAVIKVDISTLTGPLAVAPTAVSLVEAQWDIQGFTCVKLFWDHTTDDEMKILSGSGYVNYENTPLMDPRSTGGTGDVLLTTVGGVSGDTYDITLGFRLKA